MKIKPLKNKKVLLSIFAIIVIVGVSISLLLPPKAPQDSVREREYIASKGNITVGVETSSKIDTLPNAHTFEANTVVDQVLIKVGSEVKKGDKLATISAENIADLIAQAKNTHSEAKAALLQASSAKNLLISQNDKDKQDGIIGTQQEFDVTLAQLAKDKERIESTIRDYEAQINDLDKRISDLSSQIKNTEQKITDLQTKINANILKIGELNEKLLKVDDGAIARANLNQEIANAQAQIQALGTQLAAAVTPEDIVKINEQIEQYKTQIQNATLGLSSISDGSDETNAIRLEITKLENQNIAMKQEIDALSNNAISTEIETLRANRTNAEAALEKEYTALSLKLEEIARTEQQYTAAMEQQGKDNSFSDYKVSQETKALGENISKASRNVEEAQENLNKLQELEKNPALYAQMDGVVTALNYKTGDAILDGKPLCVIGQLSEIMMTVPISAADIGSISLGQKVNIFVDAFAEQKFTGTVTERLLVANDNGDYPVTITIDPSEQMVLPGMKAFATIILKEKKDILTISNKAILLENGQQYVHIKNESGELVKTKIVTGFSDGRISEVLDGLSENDVAVVQE